MLKTPHIAPVISVFHGLCLSHNYEAVFISKLTCQLSSFFVQNFVQTTSTLYKQRPHFAKQRQVWVTNDDNFVRIMFTLCTNNVHVVRTTSTLYEQRPRCTNNVQVLRTTSKLYEQRPRGVILGVRPHYYIPTLGST